MQGGPKKEGACREGLGRRVRAQGGPRKESACREGLGRRVCAGRA